jgi:CRISPR-associated endonuclease Cas1
VVIGSDGMVSLAALRWLHHQKAAFINLERGGKVLTVAGPIGPKDSRLKRAQALAPSNGAAVLIARTLLVEKLHAQERIARQNLNAVAAADNIKTERMLLSTLDRIDTLRWAEARAALVYWSAWRNVRVTFPSNALARVPDHWRTFGARRSPLTGSGRLAVNPPNAMLNYLYAILESEARIAAVAVGLDPHLGLLHADTDSRPSLACDLMEAVRTRVDEYVLNCIGRQALRREWFFEERDGNCRLMAGFAARLAEAAPGLASAVVPIAESVAKALIRGQSGVPFDAAMTGTRRRPDSFLDKPGVNRRLPAIPHVCPRCGRALGERLGRCPTCAADDLEKTVPQVLKEAPWTERSAEVPTTRTSAQHRNAEAARQWNPDSLPVWLNQDFYRTRILVELKKLRTAHVARYLSWSESYAAEVRSGKRTPHRRHWETLAKLAGLD